MNDTALHNRLPSGLQGLLWRYLPGPVARLQSWRIRRRFGAASPQARRLGAVDALAAHTGWVIPSGPFSGMAYIRAAVGSALLPKLAGSYEADLQPTVRALLGSDYRTVVDIGCAEGYYAVGLARGLPDAHVYAFDLDPAGRTLCAALAARNGVSARVTVGGECTPGRLQALLVGRSLIVCDCEGCEEAVLRPDLNPALAGADLLIELHPWAHGSPGFLDRFAATHSLQLIDQTVRRPDDYPAPAALPPDQQAMALDEGRAGIQWFPVHVFLRRLRCAQGPPSAYCVEKRSSAER